MKVRYFLPQGDYEPAPNYGSYLCENAIGLSVNKTGNHILISLGKGKDYAKGFVNSPNIYRSATIESRKAFQDQQVSGKVELSKKPDTFLNGTSVVKGISSVLER